LMKIKKRGTPEEGDIVLATVVRVAPHAAFIELDNYDGVEGLIHISEISKSWVKNIKTFFRDRQKVVCKVVDVKRPGFIHASIRRVSDYDRRAKWDQIKHQRMVENILEMVAKKLKKKPEKLYEELLPLEKKYGGLYFAFEEAKKKGKKLFEGIPGSEVLWEVVNKRISLPTVRISGILRLESRAGNGIERIKKLLSGVDADVLYLGAPRYRLSVSGMDYKEAEKKLGEIVKSMQKEAGKTETVSFEREKKK